MTSPRWLSGLFAVCLLGGGELWADDWKEVFQFQEDCAGATAETLPGLIERLGKMEESYSKGNAFIAVAEAWFRLQPLLGKAAFPSNETPLPPLPEGFPAELVPAISRYQKVTAPFDKLKTEFTKSKQRVAFLSHEQEYWKLLSDMLADQNPPFSSRVLAFNWGHWCGTGSDRFYAPQSRAILMALLRDQRWAEAAGACLSVYPQGAMDGTVRIFSSLVADPVLVVAGGLALAGLPPHDHYKTQNTRSLLGLMVVLPGDERIRLLTTLAARASPENLTTYYRALGKFVPRHEEPGDARWPTSYFSSGDNLSVLKASSVGQAAQTTALDFLCAQATPSLPVEAAKELVRVFLQKRHPSMRSALHRLLEHPSATVAQEAAAALTKLGEKVEMPAKLGPVRYRILINGQPYASQKVSWYVGNKSGGSIGSEVTTTADGIAELSRDYFLGDSLETVALRSARATVLPQAWFAVYLPVPPPTDDLIPVNVETAPQTIHLELPRPDAELADENMEVVLWGEQSGKSAAIGFWMPAEFSLPVSPKITLPGIQRGTYRLEIRIPGFTTRTETLTLGASEEVTLAFQRGSDIHFTPKLPAGWDVRAIFPELRQNGKRVDADWDDEKRILRGVPAGSYTLHLPSSTEVRKRVMGLLPDGPEFSGTDVPFDVPDSPPKVLDLGEIPLKILPPHQ